MNRVRISLTNGEVHHAEGYASDVVQTINAKRGTSLLVALERPTIPTGQFFYIDPNQVASIKDAR